MAETENFGAIAMNLGNDFPMLVNGHNPEAAREGSVQKSLNVAAGYFEAEARETAGGFGNSAIKRINTIEIVDSRGRSSMLLALCIELLHHMPYFVAIY